MRTGGIELHENREGMWAQTDMGLKRAQAGAGAYINTGAGVEAREHLQTSKQSQTGGERGTYLIYFTECI